MGTRVAACGVAQSCDRPLEALASAFHRRFNKSDFFRIGASICILLQDNLLTAPEVRARGLRGRRGVVRSWPLLRLLAQRVAAFYLLCELYRQEGDGTNPFMPAFLDALQQSTDVAEKRFITHLVLSPPSNREVSAAAKRCRQQRWPLPAPAAPPAWAAFAAMGAVVVQLR